MNTIQGKVSFKNLIWFYIAANSLLLAGALISSNHSFKLLSFLIWCNISGLFLIYRFNDCMDRNNSLRKNIAYFLSFLSHKIIFIQLIIVVIPLALFFVEKEALSVLAISSSLGFLYAINININNETFQLKNVFLVKNLLIGLAWGSLVLIGSKDGFHTPLIGLFIYCSMQVFIGGTIRDIPDLKVDKLNKVNSLPVVLGVQSTIVIMHVINALSIGVCFLITQNYNAITLFLVPIIWRVINLILVQKYPEKPSWSQWMNLFTCVIILLSTLLYVVLF